MVCRCFTEDKDSMKLQCWIAFKTFDAAERLDKVQNKVMNACEGENLVVFYFLLFNKTSFRNS